MSGVRMLGPPPRASGCTIQPDYSFDASACWAAPPSEADTVVNGIPTSVALTGRASCSDSGAFVQTQTSQGDTVTLCMFEMFVTSSRWSSWGITTSFDPVASGQSELYEIISVPSSRRKCFPGPTSCMYRYEGTGCPDGHVPLNTAVQNHTSTLFCCPSGRGLDATLRTIGLFNTLVTQGSISWDFADGPLLACAYGAKGDKRTDEMFPVSDSPHPLLSMISYSLNIKAITIELTDTRTLSSPTSISNATPKSTPSTPIDTTSPSPSTSLSTPTKIGIGVGVGLGSAFLLGTMVMLVLLRRLRRKRNTSDEGYDGKPELDGRPTNQNIHACAHEVQNSEVHEMDGICEPVEIERSRDIREMEDTALPAEADGRSNIPEMESQ